MATGTVQLNTNHRIPVTPWSWLFASIAILLALVVFFFITLLFSDVKRSFAYQGLQTSLETGNTIRGREFLDYLSQPPTQLEQYRLPGFEPASPWDRLLFSRAKQYFEALSMLQRRRLDRVLDILRSAPLDESLLPESPVLTELIRSGTSLEKLTTEVGQFVNSHNVIQSKVDFQKTRITEYESDRDSSRQQYGLITQDFRDLLGYPTFRDIGVRHNLPRYGGGVLRDLPTLPGIRDNVMTLRALKEVLDRTGGAVSATGPKEFSSALERIRIATKEITKTFDTATVELAESKKAIAALQSQAHQLRLQIRNILTKLVIIHSYREAQPATEALLSKLR